MRAREGLRGGGTKMRLLLQLASRPLLGECLE